MIEIPMKCRIERLMELHRRRQLACLAEQLAERVYAPGASSAGIIAGLRTRLEDIAR